MAADPAKKRNLSTAEFNELCEFIRSLEFPKPTDETNRFQSLNERLAADRMGGLSPEEFDIYRSFGIGIATRAAKDERPWAKRLSELFDRLQPKKRPTTPFDDALLALTTMVCVQCGGAIRLDMIAKAVYAKFAWRKFAEIPERVIAADLGLCIETVADATRRLECCGLLTCRRNRGKKRWNHYTLTPLEAVRGISMSRSLHRVFAEGEDPNDIYMDAKPAPCRCLPAVHRSRKKNPTPPDAVHPVPPDAHESDTARSQDPTPPDARPDTARSHKLLTEEQRKEEQRKHESYAFVRLGSLSQTEAQGAQGDDGDDGVYAEPGDDGDDSPRSEPTPLSPNLSNPPMVGEPNHRAVHPVPPDAREEAGSSSERARANAHPTPSNSAEAVRPIPPRKPLPEPDSGYNDDGTTFGAVPPAALTAQQAEQVRRAEGKARYQRRKASAAEAKRISEMPW